MQWEASCFIWMDGWTDGQSQTDIMKLTVTFCRCSAECQGMCSVRYPIGVNRTEIETDLTVSIVTNGKWWMCLC